MRSYGVERIGRLWVVFAYRDLKREFAVQDCFTLREAKALVERLEAEVTR